MSRKTVIKVPLVGVRDRYLDANGGRQPRGAFVRRIGRRELDKGERIVEPPVRCPTCGGLVQIVPCRICRNS